jgi:hypothetical protein
MAVPFKNYRDGQWMMRYVGDEGVASVEELLFDGPMKNEAAVTRILLLFFLTNACDDGSYRGGLDEMVKGASMGADEVVTGLRRLLELCVLTYEDVQMGEEVRVVFMVNTDVLDKMFLPEPGYDTGEVEGGENDAVV